MQYRYYDILIRQDDLPADWFDSLATSGFRGYVSPLHDHDGIKPHYHVLISSPYPITFRFVSAFFDGLAGGCFIHPVKSIKGAQAYLLDLFHSPGRSITDILCFGGADLGKIY